MSTPRSATLAIWTSAWLAGQASSDDVIDAVTGGDGPHVVLDLPVQLPAQAVHEDALSALSGERSPRTEVTGPARLGAALIAWRTSGAGVRLALPVAGDVRGVPGPAPFIAAALAAGEAVYGGGLGLVPSREPTASSAPAPVTWRAFAVGTPPTDPMQLNEAEHELAVAIRETATLFRAADLTGGGTGAVAEELARARRAGERLTLPPGFSARATALVAQAERLSIVVDIANRDARGGAIDRIGMGTRADALRALATTVRRARLIAYNCGYDD